MPTSRIHVQHSDGSPARQVRVTLGFPAGLTEGFYTDDRGWTVVEHKSVGQATIYVSGRESGRMHTPGTGSVVL
jgi:hypothetical protein